ncbi:stage II sporulation protein E [Alicyclobacillus hesperidum subsp. aegles]|uniref:Stage II sporulation protein E n=1 Tax=Alicyclobacillus hesperidum TaxID=89784 RepID=A0A1H2TM33_9BACL|nr:stage II sporulation protein E [Alicyclobacillus hesperidum]GLG02380.1 stage II sporulation protein E [Alicyclobacillus hesperidum subsp. aegles]SDW44755.1 stage II sporulation protein E [Alicyclobacillus hesperidum]
MVQLSSLHKRQKNQQAPVRTAVSPRWTWRAWRRVALLAVLGLLLGRANIDHVVSPFGLAYFAVLAEVAGQRRAWPAYAAVIGALTTGIDNGFLMFASLVLYRLVRRFVIRRESTDLMWIPIAAGGVGFLAKLGMYGTGITGLEVLVSFAEGALVTILSLIFIQCMNLFVGQETSRTLRYEQLLSVIILIASVIMGFDGLQVHNVSVALVAVDWLVLVMSAGGMGMCAAGAIAVSMLTLLNHQSSLPEVAIFGFAGLLCGLLRDTHKVLIALAFVLATTVLTLTYAHGYTLLLDQMIAAGVASIGFLITPLSLSRELRSFVPGTTEHSAEERARAHRVHALLTEKISEVSLVFDELSESFADTSDSEFQTAQQLVTQMVEATRQTVCSLCPRRSRCWEKESVQTYHAIANTLRNLEMSAGRRAVPSPELRERCIRLDPLLGTLRYNLDITHRDAKWLQKLRDQRTLLSAQLSGVAEVVRTMARELDAEQQTLLSDEEQILGALEQLGLYVDDVHIVSLEPGKVEIEVVQPTEGAYETAAKMIAPLLSGVLGEHISVSHVHVSEGGGPCTSVFASARLFQVNTAVAAVARDGRLVSGDTHTTVDLGNGRYAVAVSDGMGNGERARQESKAAIDLLKKLMKAGFDEKLAIRTVNSTLLLRSRDEMFTTLDMALIDLFNAKAEFLKVGSAPSYVKRGNDVIEITGSNVPIGILQDIEVQAIEQQLYPGDILILVSDGLYDAPLHRYDGDSWLKKVIADLTVMEPQAIADELIEHAVRMNHGLVRDDMTVVVAVVERSQEEWAAIKLPNIPSLRKPHKSKRGA